MFLHSGDPDVISIDTQKCQADLLQDRPKCCAVGIVVGYAIMLVILAMIHLPFLLFLPAVAVLLLG